MLTTLYYRLSGDRRHDRQMTKMVRAIVAGHERADTPGHATISADGLIRLFVPPQLAESANWWMDQVAFRGWDPATEARIELRTYNNLTLIMRSGAILVPDGGPNGGYGLRNGGVKNRDTTCIPQAKCSRLRFKRAKSPAPKY